jgi:class 3 adenylate cyclase/tetratricopeptide (TPR) repeat protein
MTRAEPVRRPRRGRVARVAALYAVVGGVTVAIGRAVVPAAYLPDWVARLVLLLVLIGFPLALVLAWARDGERIGVRRTGPAEWGRVQELFEQVISLPTEERSVFVARATADDEGLRGEVRSLLLAHERRGPLDRSIEDWLELPSLLGQPIGGTVGRYRIVEKLGEGGMGVVYSARDERLERLVALKFLPPHLSARDDAKQRFMVEAQAAAALDHPNVCTVHEIGETPRGQLFIAMPLYDGETIKARIARGPLPLDEAVDLAIQAARGLAKAHDRGIVHRDIKPANLIVTSDGVLKIVDFGIAKLADVTITRAEEAPGTISYMSPEHARGDPVDGRSDLWSLGVVLYEAVTGARPFRGGTDHVVLHQIATAPVTIPRLADDTAPVLLGGILTRMLAKDPNDRHPKATDLVRDLERWVTARAHALREGGEGGRAAPIEVDDAPGAGPLLTDATERHPATAVVSALSGYAGLVERLPPDQLAAFVERVREAAEEIVTRHGGVLNELREDELVMLFGVPTAQEDHGVRAVRAALELHERVRSMRQERTGVNRDLRLHTGVDQGPVVARPAGSQGARYLVVGDAVRLARRLAAHAAADEVWISPDCHRAAGPFFDTEARPPIASPLGGSVTPRRVLRHRGIRSRLEAAVRTGLTRYVGRERDLARLQEALDAALVGGGRLVVVTGEPGVGKSRLVYEFRQRIANGGHQLLVGRCHAHGANTSYLPFAEVLRSCLGVDPAAGPGAAAARVALRAQEIAPELSTFIPLYLHLLDLDSPAHPLLSHLYGDQLRVVMQEATTALLAFTARARPLVLILEDWHWADDASQSVLEQVLEVAADEPLLVLVTSRTAFTWESPGRHEVIQLEALAEDASVAMLGAIAGVDGFDPAVASILHARTGGNPFFLEEICHALLEDGTLQVREGTVRLTAPVDSLQLPDTVQAVIHTRLQRLERESRDLVRLASVVGREFSRGVLERAVPGSGRLPNALQALKAAGLIQQVRVVPEAVYRFKHVLTQEVAYNSLLEHQRRELHGRVAAAIEERHRDRLQDQLQRLAYHHRHAGHWAEAIDYGVRAADRLHGLSEFTEALLQLERCEEWLEHSPIQDATRLRVGILLRQERLCETLGLRARQQELIDRLIELLEATHDRPSLAEVYLRQGDLFTLLRSFERADTALVESRRLWRELGDAVGERNAIRSRGMMFWHARRHAEALAMIDEALELDRRRGDTEGVVGDLASKGAVLKGLGDLEAARLVLVEAYELSERELAADTGLPGGLKLPYILHNLANVYREMGDSERALAMLRQSMEIGESKHLPIQVSYHGTAIAHILLQQGKLEESVEAYRMSVDAARRARFTPGLSQALVALGEVLVGLGRPEEALPRLQEARAYFTQLRDAPGELRAVEAIARARGRAAEGAAEAYGEALALAIAVPDAEAEARMRNSLGIIAWNRKDYDGALRHYTRALPILRRLGDAAALGLVLNSIGVTLVRLGRHDEAGPVLLEALGVHQRAGKALLESHAETALGEIAELRGDPAAARGRYERSLDLRREAGDTSGAGWTMHRLARLEAVNGSMERAAELMEGARALAVQCGDDELLAACGAALVHE